MLLVLVEVETVEDGAAEFPVELGAMVEFNGVPESELSRV